MTGGLGSVTSLATGEGVLLLIIGPPGKNPGCNSCRSPTKPTTSTVILAGGNDGSSMLSMLLWSAWLRSSCSVLVLGVLVYSRLAHPTHHPMTSASRTTPLTFRMISE